VTQSQLAASLRAAVDAEDAERVRDLVVQATEKDRRAAAEEVRQLYEVRWTWNRRRESKREAATVAWLGTATARQVGSQWWTVERVADDRGLDLVYDVLEARGSRFFQTLARSMVEEGVQRWWPLVRRAVTNGLIEAPEDVDAYVRGMVATFAWTREEDGTYDGLLADPALLDEDVWQIFEIDCSAILAEQWQRALVRLAGEGRLDRQRLLDASLGALLRDFRASSVGWYAQLHESLEPSDEERRLRVDTYLSLLASPAAAVIKEGLSALRAIEDEVAADDLARAAAGPLSQKQKNLAVDMLRLLERKAKQEPDARAAVLEAATLALGHERADVQERALALLERYPSKAPRAALLGLAEAVAPQLRPRAQALTGIAPEPESAQVVVVPPSTPTIGPDVADLPPPVPVESVDELIELATFLLEGQGTGDDVERFLDGVSRLCDERPSGFERRTAGLRKRVEDAGWRRFGSSAADSVTLVVSAWVSRRRHRGLRTQATLLGFLSERAMEVAARAARRSARPLLAFPTQAGGRIDPDVLAERERGFGRYRNRPHPADHLQARVRALTPVQPVRYERRMIERKVWEQNVRSLELRPDRLPEALGRLGGPAAAVGRPLPQSIWLETAPWGSWDALGARWCLTLLPAFPEIAFAGAASLIVDTLDAAPQLHPQPVVEHALTPSVPLGDVAWLAIAGALVAKSPDLRRVATDVLVASIADGRFDADAAGEAIAWLTDEGLAKASRLEAPLRDAGRVSTLHAAQIVRLAEAVIARLQATPHGLHGPLEVMLEHATSAGVEVQRADARAALERVAGEVSSSSKLGRLAHSLLHLPG